MGWDEMVEIIGPLSAGAQVGQQEPWALLGGNGTETLGAIPEPKEMG